MAGYIVRRLLALIPLLLIVSFGVFSLVAVIPGDPAVQIAGGVDASDARIAQVREELGLDKPFLERYVRWLGDAAHGDLGTSLFQNRPVSEAIRDRFPVTLSLAVGAMVVTLLLGVPMGIVAGTRPGSFVDRAVTFFSSAAIAMPEFWLAMILVVFLAVKVQWFPAIGYTPLSKDPADWLRHLYLPCFAMGLGGSAALARQLRGSLMDTLDQDFIRTADAKGVRRSFIVAKHALKNAAIAPVTVLGLQFAYLLGGTVIIEQIFAIPGMGQYFFLALGNRDLPVIQGVVLVVAVTFVTINLAIDVLYAYLNPKVRLS